jgi:hypothetical protein
MEKDDGMFDEILQVAESVVQILQINPRSSSRSFPAGSKEFSTVHLAPLQSQSKDLYCTYLEVKGLFGSKSGLFGSKRVIWK